MFRWIFGIALTVSGLLWGGSYAVESGKWLEFLDEHSNESWVAPAEYVTGQGLVLFNKYQMASLYFSRVANKSGTSDIVDDSLYAYVRALDDGGALKHQELVVEYQKYLDRFPTAIMHR